MHAHSDCGWEILQCAVSRTKRFSYKSEELLRSRKISAGWRGAEMERTHPSLNVGIPQYRARHDKHCKSYFSSKKALPKISSSPDSYDVYCDENRL